MLRKEEESLVVQSEFHLLKVEKLEADSELPHGGCMYASGPFVGKWNGNRVDEVGADNHEPTLTKMKVHPIGSVELFGILAFHQRDKGSHHTVNE